VLVLTLFVNGVHTFLLTLFNTAHVLVNVLHMCLLTLCTCVAHGLKLLGPCLLTYWLIMMRVLFPTLSVSFFNHWEVFLTIGYQVLKARLSKPFSFNHISPLIFLECTTWHRSNTRVLLDLSTTDADLCMGMHRSKLLCQGYVGDVMQLRACRNSCATVVAFILCRTLSLGETL